LSCRSQLGDRRVEFSQAVKAHSRAPSISAIHFHAFFCRMSTEEIALMPKKSTAAAAIAEKVQAARSGAAERMRRSRRRRGKGMHCYTLELR